MKRTCRWTILIAVLACLLFVGGSWLSAQRLTRARPSEIGAAPADFPYPIESITFKSSDDQTLSGWLVPAQDPKRAIILLHGYTGNRKHMLERARFFRELGYGGCSTMPAAARHRRRHRLGYRNGDLIAAVNCSGSRPRAIACAVCKAARRSYSPPKAAASMRDLEASTTK